MDTLKQAVLSFLALPILNKNVRDTVTHLANVSLYELKGLNGLQPVLRDKVKDLILRMKILGKPVYLAQGYRSAAEQDNKYNEGRTLPGAIITNARGLQSYHQYGLAADLVFIDYNWSPPSQSWWETLGEEAEALGLEWGGRWTGLVDLPHVELHPGFDWKLLESYFKQ